MYVSPLFQGARMFAKSRFDRWYILSAKYGLLEPSEIIKPYEKTLKTMSGGDRKRWASKTSRQLLRRLQPGDAVTFLAGEKYREFLVPELISRGYEVTVPLEGMSIGYQLQWYKKFKSEQKRLDHLDKFYALLAKLENGLGKRRMSECTGQMDWPKMGVYFFFEQAEKRTTLPSSNRVVRVGTHTVSRGSNTTLWHRLRTHRGSADQGGNHRGSIFRLHVGAAILKRSNNSRLIPTWGVGQTASMETRAAEAELERLASAYIGSMSLLWLAIGDEPRASSDRAYIERNSIALLAGSTGPLDLPSPSWLGHFSQREAIRRSGLWNVNYVNDSYEEHFLDIFATFVDATLGRKPVPLESIAPKDWYSFATRKDRSQLNLFDNSSINET
jgi:hypothetical protein